jgi:hypothetical protein
LLLEVLIASENSLPRLQSEPLGSDPMLWLEADYRKYMAHPNELE